MLAGRADGAAFELGSGLTVPLSDQLHLTGRGGVFRNSNGTLTARDGQLGAAWFAVSGAAFTVKVRPGISLPLGGVAAGLEFTMLSSGSVDPVLGVDLLVGGAWMVATSIEGRVTLYPGFDEIRQGPYGRLDVKVARRLGEAVLFAGISGVGQRRYDNGVGAFAEISPVAGAVLAVSERWSLTAQARVPVWTDTTPHPYFAAGGVGVTRVVGKVAENHTHGGEDGEEHGDDE